MRGLQGLGKVMCRGIMDSGAGHPLEIVGSRKTFFEALVPFPSEVLGILVCFVPQHSGPFSFPRLQIPIPTPTFRPFHLESYPQSRSRLET